MLHLAEIGKKFLSDFIYFIHCLKSMSLDSDCLGWNPSSTTSNNVIISKLLSLSEPLLS